MALKMAAAALTAFACDDGVYDGGEVSMFYDPMIAKLITWGANARRSR